VVLIRLATSVWESFIVLRRRTSASRTLDLSSASSNAARNDGLRSDSSRYSSNSSGSSLQCDSVTVLPPMSPSHHRSWLAWWLSVATDTTLDCQHHADDQRREIVFMARTSRTSQPQTALCGDLLAASAPSVRSPGHDRVSVASAGSYIPMSHRRR